MVSFGTIREKSENKKGVKAIMKTLADYERARKKMPLKEKIRRVKLARRVLKSDFFSEGQKTEICDWLGFHDTEFREKCSAAKLDDFLLSEKPQRRN